MRLARRRPHERNHREQHQGADDVRIEQGGAVGIGAGENAGDDGIERVEQRGGEREQRRRMETARARARHHQHADEADGDRRPAAPAHPLAQHRPRQRSDEERRREHQRDRLVELEEAQRGKIAQRRSEQQHRASDLQHRPRGPHQPRRRPWIRHDEREQESAGVARPHDLQRVHVEVEIFRRGVEHGKARHRRAHQRDAGEARSALLRCVVVHGGGSLRSGL